LQVHSEPRLLTSAPTTLPDSLPQSASHWLSKARSLAEDLLSYSIPGYSGHCWGYPFDWQNNKGLWRKNTPFITCTPYCFEAFLNLYDATGEERYLDIAASIARFVESDLKDTPAGVDASAASYSPHDDSKVVNASAYRAYVLFEAVHRIKPEFPSPPSGERIRRASSRLDPLNPVRTQWNASPSSGLQLGTQWNASLPVPAGRFMERAGVRGNSLLTKAERDRCVEKARRNLNFILQSQRDDGSWLYAMDNPAEAFIDHFHTCFVLKNLVKINRWLREPKVSEAVRRGYAYYRRALFHADGTPKSFAIKPRLEIVRLEMYNVAEAITLGALLKDEIPEALQLAQRLAQRLVEEWQLNAGHFVTRVYRGGLRHTFPFLRWAQAQLFYALTNLLRARQ
jgi:hypothetical protein